MRMRFSIDVEVPAKKVWRELSEGFGDTGKWTSLLDSSKLIGEAKTGAHRECRIGNKTLTEHITLMDNEMMRVDYKLIDGLPAIVEHGYNSWSVTALSETRCRVALSPDIKMKWWSQPLGMLVHMGLKQSMTKVLEEFKHWAETGRVHPRKAKRNKKSGVQQLATAS